MQVGEQMGAKFRITIDQRIAGARGVGAHVTSMLQDYRLGRPLEVGALCMAVQELGKKVNVATPTLDVILALVNVRTQSRQLQSGKL